MKIRKLSILSILLVTTLGLAQEGTNVYPFLNIPFSPRQAVLGGDVVSIRDYDPNFAAINPAMMNIEMDNRLTVNYMSYLADSKFGTLSYVKDLERGHLFSLNARYMDYGKMPRTDENAMTSGDFSAMDAAVGAGYAYQIEDNWTIGANVNFVTSKIDTYTSMAVSGSVGISYYSERNKETLSLVARNFGYQMKPFNGVRERLPFRLDLGYTKILEQFPVALTITAHDLQQFNISQTTDLNGQEVGFGRKILDHFSFGAELFPEQAFNIRFGYNVKRGNEMAVLDQRNFSGLSAGFGMKISYFRFDFSHMRYHNASNVNMFGITMDLIEIGGNRR